MTDHDIELEARVRTLCEQARPMLDDSSRDAIDHYLDHGEHEMAFEGACIELVRSGALSSAEALPFIALAKALGLDTNASFDERIIARLEAL